MSCYLLPAITSYFNYPYYSTLYTCNSICCGSDPNPVMSSSKDLSPPFVPAAVLMNPQTDLLGSPAVFQATQNSLFYQVVSEHPGTSCPIEIHSLCRQQAMTTSSSIALEQKNRSTISSDHLQKVSAGVFRLGVRGVYRRRKRNHDSGSGGADVPVDRDTDQGSLYPLYCSLCRVKLNAQTQARQHYTGKQHKKRLKALTRGKINTDEHRKEKNSSSSEEANNQKSLTQEGQQKSKDHHETSDASTNELESLVRKRNGTHSFKGLSCDIYCFVCAVSFNSTTQAKQHYHGKTHARRMRSTNGLPRSASRNCMNEFFTKHKDALYTCLVCNSKPSSLQHRKKRT